MRLFVAVDPPDAVVAEVAELPRPEFRAVRWTTPAQWHVTVRFLGELDPGALDGRRGLVAALDTVAEDLARHDAVPVRAELGPTSAWFPGRRALQVPVSGLEEVADAVAGATAAWGLPPEGEFRGHLTLARTRGQARGPAAFAGAPIAAEWVVDELVLYSSALGPGGSRYEAVHRVALGG